MELDLHMHSTASDGTESPASVVEAAVAARLDVIALSDHDTVAGVDEAVRAAEGHPLHVIPALEVSSTCDEGELHILGYFVDTHDAGLVEHGRSAHTQRAGRMRAMIERLGTQGVDVTFEAVQEVAAEERTNLGRPHLAKALFEAGYVSDPVEAFDRYIGNEHPAYIPTRLIDPEGAIEMIRNAGGVAVWAHPPMDQLDALLPRLVRGGLQGLEVYRPRAPRRRLQRLEQAARDAELVVSGGSDWHGPDSGTLGEFRVHSRDVADLLELGGL